MKRILFLLVILIAIGSLYSQDILDLETDSTPQQVELMSLSEREAFLNNYQGEYLEQHFYDELIRTKSPYKSITYQYGMPFIEMKKNWDDKDSFIVTSQGRFLYFIKAFFPYVKSDSMMFHYQDNLYSFRLRIPEDEADVIYMTDKYPDYESRYIKIPSVDSLLNVLTIAGKYMNNEETSEQEVKFNIDGTIKGLGDFEIYKVIVDCLNETADLFWMKGDSSAIYFFEMIDDNLYIYQAEEDYYDDDSEDFEWVRGNLLYKLTRMD